MKIASFLKSLDKIDKSFVLVLIIGILLRVISLIFIPIGPDYITYVNAARGIIELDYFKYETFRPPAFSLLIIPFLFITKNNYVLSAKLASFFISIILIYYSYYAFIEASKKLYNEDNKKREYKAKLTGLIVSFLVSLNFYFAVNTGRGLREDLLTLLFILAFYYSIIKKDMDIKDNLWLAFIISFLTLTLLSAGIFFISGIILYFLLSKIKKVKIKPISSRKVLLIILAFIFSFVFWALFSAISVGNPLYNWSRQGSFFREKHDLDLSTIDGLIEALINAIILGVPFEIYYLFLLISFIFTLLVFYTLFKNYKQKQVLLIFLIVGINLLYISIFMAPSKVLLIPNHPRVMIYLFPFIFYLGTIPLVHIMVRHQKRDKNYSYNPNFLFFLFLITYTLQGFMYWGDYHGFPPPIHILLLPLYLINEVFLLIYLIKSRDISYSKLKNSNKL
jgi:hypothetical protein